jgi:hypothetical protein
LLRRDGTRTTSKKMRRDENREDDVERRKRIALRGEGRR